MGEESWEVGRSNINATSRHGKGTGRFFFFQKKCEVLKDYGAWKQLVDDTYYFSLTVVFMMTSRKRFIASELIEWRQFDCASTILGCLLVLDGIRS